MAKKTATKKKAEPKPAAWRNRIVRSGELPASQFLAHEGNWRIHPTAQQEVLRGLIGNAVGWIAPVIVNVRTSTLWPVGDRNVETVVDGHLRIQLALREGDETPVPVSYVDLTPQEERMALATFDPVAALAAHDTIKFDELVADLPDSHVDLTAILEHVQKPKKRTAAKGLRHDVKRCLCCADGKCKNPDCGCYREER
jgi:hypothetical protein